MSVDVLKVPGRILAWTALLVALAASVAANVAFARPAVGPRLSAATAPLLVVLAAGLLERVPLARARWWQRWLAGGGLVFVVLAAFVTSYQHQHALLLAYGSEQLSAVLLPFAVDALIVMSSVCLAVIAEQRRELADLPNRAEIDYVRTVEQQPPNEPPAANLLPVAATEVRGPVTAEPSAEVQPVAVAERSRPARTQTSPRNKPEVRGRRKVERSPRRTAEQTRQAATELRAQHPEISKAEVARLLGISATRLRQVERAANGTEVPTT